MAKKATKKKKATTKKKVMVAVSQNEINKRDQKGFSLLARIAVSLEKQNDISEMMVKKVIRMEKIFILMLGKENPNDPELQQLLNELKNDN